MPYTVLLVRTPSGRWFFDDDNGPEHNARLRLSTPVQSIERHDDHVLVRARAEKPSPSVQCLVPVTSVALVTVAE